MGKPKNLPRITFLEKYGNGIKAVYKDNSIWLKVKDINDIFNIKLKKQVVDIVNNNSIKYANKDNYGKITFTNTEVYNGVTSNCFGIIESMMMNTERNKLLLSILRSEVRLFELDCIDQGLYKKDLIIDEDDIDDKEYY